jgi:mannose-6-phosphate isomerase-like protein (cupin superfamily)
MKQGKIWGHTEDIFTKNNVSIHRIYIKKDSCCSKHYHDNKHNMFFVEDGTLLIRHWQNDYNLIDETILKTGESCCIPPKHYHQFVALTDVVAYEIYYVELNDKDIIIENCGSDKYEICSSSKQ